MIVTCDYNLEDNEMLVLDTCFDDGQDIGHCPAVHIACNTSVRSFIQRRDVAQYQREMTTGRVDLKLCGCVY